MVVDLDSPFQEKGTKMDVELLSQQEASVIDVAPLSFVIPTSSLLALTWKEGDTQSDKGVIGSKREIEDAFTSAQEDFAAAMELLSPLVEEIVSGVDPIHEALLQKSLADRDEVGDAQTSSPGKGENAREPNGMSS